MQTGDITYKPAVTPQVAAAKQSWLGRVYLDWAEFPLVTDVGNDPVAGEPPPEPNWHAVEFDDMRFGYSAFGERLEPQSRAKSAGRFGLYRAGNEVEQMFIGGREQK